MRSASRAIPFVVLALLASSVGSATPVVSAASVLPTYRVDVVVPSGVATAINESGDLVGWQSSSGSPKAFVHRGGVLKLLPTAPDRPLSVARDINNAGVVVGYAYQTAIDQPGHAMRWTLGQSGWEVKDLGFLTGDLVSEATAVNEAGQIVGRSNARSSLFEQSFLYTDSAGMSQLLPGYAFAAQDINEEGVVVGPGYTVAQSVDTATGIGTSLGTLAPYGYSYAYAINDSGQVAGAMTTATGSAQVIARHDAATGWQVLGGLGQTNIGWGINGAGTVVGEGWARTGVSPAFRGVIYLDVQGSLMYVDDLLEAGSEWSVYRAYDINDAGQIAGYARNRVTGATAGVRLSPVGTLAVPATPSNLTATAFAAATSQEQNHILLRWSDNSTNETGFQVERRRIDAIGAPLTEFSLIASVNANTSVYPDPNITPAYRYEYRVRASGIAGPSAYSNAASAWAPSTSTETVPPSVAITKPVSGATVSGVIKVKIKVTDNDSVARVELLVGSRLAGACRPGLMPDMYACKWDTRKFSNGGWTLYARAWDKSGNLGQHSITVFVRNVK